MGDSASRALPRLFLSYARADDEPFVRRLHRDLAARGFVTWFDRVSMPARGLAFTREIEQAVFECDRFLLVLGPAALRSDYVTREYGFALRIGRAISPLLRVGRNRDVPAELRLLDIRDFTDNARYPAEFERLLQQISEPPAPLGKLIAVPALPQHFLLREERLEAIKDAIRIDTLQAHRDARGRPAGVCSPARRAGLLGMGGIGKSVLAATLCHDATVRRLFRDGIAWVGIGQNCDDGRLLAQLRGLVESLGGDAKFDSLDAGKARLRDALEDKSVLLVLDDVWRRRDAEAFDALGATSRMLITTRDASLVTALGGSHHPVELLTEDEARCLLGEWAGAPVATLPAESSEVIGECGRLPLALSICGAMIRDKATRWQDLVEAFREADLAYLEHPQGVAGYESTGVFKAIQIGVDALDEEERRRFAELTVFPADRATPAAAAYTLWEHTGPLRERHARALMAKLIARSLVQRVAHDPAAGASDVPFILHDLLYDYAVPLAGDRKALHEMLLRAYARRCPGGWHAGPDDGYFLQRLADHLIGSGRGRELADLLTRSPQWMDVKFTALRSDDSLKGDLNAAWEQFADPADAADLLALAKTVAVSCVVASRTDHRDLAVLARVGRGDEAIGWARSRNAVADQAKGLLAVLGAGHDAGGRTSAALAEVARQLLARKEPYPVMDLVNLADALSRAREPDLSRELIERAGDTGIGKARSGAKDSGMPLLLERVSGPAFERLHEEVLQWPAPKRLPVGFSLAKGLARAGRYDDARKCLDWYAEEAERFYCNAQIVEGMAGGGAVEEAVKLFTSLAGAENGDAAVLLLSPAALALATKGEIGPVNRLADSPDLNPAKWIFGTRLAMARGCIRARRPDDALRFARSPAAGTEHIRLLSEIVGDLAPWPPQHEQVLDALIREAMRSPRIEEAVVRACWLSVLRSGPDRVRELAARMRSPAPAAGAEPTRPAPGDDPPGHAPPCRAEEALLLKAGGEQGMARVLITGARAIAEAGHSAEAAFLLDESEAGGALEAEMRELCKTPAVFAVCATLSASKHSPECAAVLRRASEVLLDYANSATAARFHLQQLIYLQSAALCANQQVDEATALVGKIDSPLRRACIRFAAARRYLETGQFGPALAQVEAANAEPRVKEDARPERIAAAAGLVARLPAVSDDAERRRAVSAAVAASTAFADALPRLRPAVFAERWPMLWEVGCLLAGGAESAAADDVLATALRSLAAAQEPSELAGRVAAALRASGQDIAASAVLSALGAARVAPDAAGALPRPDRAPVQEAATAPDRFEPANLVARGKVAEALRSLAGVGVAEFLCSVCALARPGGNLPPPLGREIVREAVRIGGWKNAAWREIDQVLAVPGAAPPLPEGRDEAAEVTGRGDLAAIPTGHPAGPRLAAAAHYLASVTAWGAGSYGPALLALRAALEADGREPEYWWDYAWFCLASGDVTAARAHIDRANSLAGNARYWSGYVWLAADTGEWDAVPAVLGSEAVKRQVGSDGAFWHGIVALRRGAYREALEQITQSLQGADPGARAIADFWKEVAAHLADGAPGPIADPGGPASGSRPHRTAAYLTACYAGRGGEARAAINCLLGEAPGPWTFVKARGYLNLLHHLFPSNATVEAEREWVAARWAEHFRPAP